MRFLWILFIAATSAWSQVPVVSTLADLLAQPVSTRDRVHRAVDVMGITSIRDGAPLTRWIWNPTNALSTNSAIGGRILRASTYLPPGSVGRWELPWYGDPRVFGMTANDLTDDSRALQAACDFAYAAGTAVQRPTPAVVFPPGSAGNYYVAGVTTRVSIISLNGSATGFWNSEPVRFSPPIGVTNDCLILDSENEGRSITIRGLNIYGRHHAGPRRAATLTSVTDRLTMSVNPADLPNFANWGQKGGPPYYGWVGFWTMQNYYLGAAMLQTVNTNTGALTFYEGTDNYATVTGTNLLEVGKAKLGFGQVATITDPQYGPTTGGVDARAGYAAIEMRACKRPVIEDCSFRYWYTGVTMLMGDTLTLNNCEFNGISLFPIGTSMPGFMLSSTDNRIDRVLATGDWLEPLAVDGVSETYSWTNKAYRCTQMGLALSSALNRIGTYVVGPSVYGWVLGPNLLDTTAINFRAEGPFKEPIWQMYCANFPFGASLNFHKLEVAAREDWPMPNNRGTINVIRAANGTVYPQGINIDTLTVGSMGRTPYGADWKWSKLYDCFGPIKVSIKQYNDINGLVVSGITTNLPNYAVSEVVTPGAIRTKYGASFEGTADFYDFTDAIRLGTDATGSTNNAVDKTARVTVRGHLSANDWSLMNTFSSAGVNQVNWGGGTVGKKSVTYHGFYAGTDPSQSTGNLVGALNDARWDFYRPIRALYGVTNALQVNLPTAANQTPISIPVQGVSQVSLVVTVTNNPTMGDTLTFNALTNYWGASSSLTNFLIGADTILSASNIVANLTTFPPANAFAFRVGTNVTIRATAGLPLTNVAVSPGWASVVVSTNPAPPAQLYSGPDGSGPGGVGRAAYLIFPP